ncbi:MAG: hypothetical protein BWZ10_02209 [candidate division BRC1 bacterium ADurb.BinA364]|nr:MAG: hypothetical protein BWZ10_02209 [candidate division BRC1 bacterium ADurb.BinA364]
MNLPSSSMASMTTRPFPPSMVVDICSAREDCARMDQRAICAQNLLIFSQPNQLAAQRIAASEVKATVLPKP